MTRWQHSAWGLLAASSIIGLWLISLTFGLSASFSELPTSVVILLIAWLTFLYTGLFITAHDAMHGTVFPANQRLNAYIGRLSVFLYALFSFRKLTNAHWQHHRHPGNPENDPDFHNGEHSGFFSWYIHFMKEYVSILQIVGMALVFNFLKYIVGIPTINLLCFWVAPSLLSTFQLFYFGTYLPHRGEPSEFSDHHHSRSIHFSKFWSFISCYHFGYHWEHHEHPNIPWWKLPSIYQKTARKNR